MKIVPVKPEMTSIPLGRQGENLRTQIVFPVQEWLEEYPEAVIGLINRRPDENTEYPVQISGIEDGTVKWTVGAAELANHGNGECTLIAIEDEVVVKSKNYHTVVFRSLSGEGDAPDPWASWAEYFIEKADTAEEAAETAVSAKEDAEAARDAAQAAAGNFQGLTATVQGLPAGSAPQVNVTHSQGGIYLLAFKIPKGDRGDPAPLDKVAAAVNAWLAANNFTNPDSPPLDRNLAAALAAAPADLVGALKRDYEIVCTYSELIDFATAGTRAGLINSSNVWSTSSPFESYRFDVDEGYYGITVTANSSADAIVGLLKNGTLNNMEAPNFCDGIDGRIIVGAGTTKNIHIPADCRYIVVAKTGSTGNDLTPLLASFAFYKTIPFVDATLKNQGDAADAKVTGDRLDKIIETITDIEDIDLDAASTRNGLINASNVWSTTAGFVSYKFAVGPEYYKMTIKAGENNATVGLLKNGTLSNMQAPNFCDGITGRIVVEPGETMEIAIPADCTYIVVMKQTNETDYRPEKIVFEKWEIGHATETGIPLGLHEKPPTDTALNIVKRCRQMTDIKWTPAADLKRYMVVQRGTEWPSAESEHYLGKFKAGVEYTGIPYGRVSSTMDDYGYGYATAGHYIDFETFITSVSNPKSKLCVENVGSVANHRSVIYASVCSGLVCYALDVDEVATSQIDNISGMTSIGKVNNNGVLLADSNFKIGDILNKEGAHAVVITDIIRDNEGVIRFIELSEATTKGCADKNYADGQTGGLCRRRGWSREQLFSPETWGEFTLLRYTRNVEYTQSPFVNVGDEFNMQRFEHLPCMPYEGNRFVYKTGHIPNSAVKIVLTLDDYGYLKVFRDGEEIAGSPFAVTGDSVDITDLTEGEYEAYLCNIEDGDVVNLTYPCSWKIE